MLIRQVWLTALTFSSARGGSIQPYVQGASEFLIQPPSGDAEIFVEHDNQAPGSWYVRLVNRHTRKSGMGPIYIPPVTTQDGLEKALKRVWDIDQQHRQLLSKCFARLREPPDASSDDADDSAAAASNSRAQTA